MERIDPARLEALAESYRCEAELCFEMADAVEGDVRGDWFSVASRWIELAKQAAAMLRAN